MKIYVSHSRNTDYVTELYNPLRHSRLPVEFIFPHEKGSDPYDSKELFRTKGCDYILAEVSHPTTGQGIELGWADIYEIPIICVYRTGSRPSGSIKIITDRIFEYANMQDLINKLTILLKLNIA